MGNVALVAGQRLSRYVPRTGLEERDSPKSAAGASVGLPVWGIGYAASPARRVDVQRADSGHGHRRAGQRECAIAPQRADGRLRGRDRPPWLSTVGHIAPPWRDLDALALLAGRAA